MVHKHILENGVTVLIRDVTEGVSARDRDTRELRRVEERFRLLVESVEDVVFRLDRDQRCLDIFGRWLEREGYTARQFLGRTTRDIVGEAEAILPARTVSACLGNRYWRETANESGMSAGIGGSAGDSIDRDAGAV